MPSPQSSSEHFWLALDAAEAQQATADALAALAAARAAARTPAQVQRLLSLAQQPGAPPTVTLPALTLLARWARQQALQPTPQRDAVLLQAAAAAGQQLLLHAAGQPRLAASCLLQLCSVAPAAQQPELVDELAEAVGTALVGPLLGTPQPASAAEVMSALGALLPCLLGKPVAACWLLAGLLRWLGSLQLDGAQPSWQALDCLAPAYGMLRGVATAALSRSSPPAAVAGLLRPAYLVLRDVALPPASPAGQPAEHPVQAAAAVLALGGLAEALLRSAAGFAEAAQLAAAAEGSLAAACDAAEAAATAEPPALAMPAGQAGIELLQDACSLAGAQLHAGVRRPQQQATPSLARCQVRSLLHSALSLAPLVQAAQAGVPAAQASEQLRQQAAGALGQQAASLASALAALYPQLDSGTQRWLVQQVSAAGRQAYQHYRWLSLAAPPGWLGALHAAVLRQLLDRLFLACLALLSAAWDAAAGAAAPPPGPSSAAAAEAAAVAAGERAQLAAAILGTLGDLQFCRLGAAQYAALLRAVLAEVPGDAAAAASLVTCLPCYADLAAACPARGQAAAWLVDGVAAAKVQLLMNALVPCCGVLPLAVLEERLAPLAFLYLLHPHPPTATAAHHLFCALLVAVPEGRREPLAAYYVQRSLEGPLDAPSLAQFGQGLATALQALPLGSPVALLCLHRVLGKCEELAAGGDPAASDLAALAAQQLLLVDHSLLDGAMAACSRVLRPGSAGAQWPGAAAASGALRAAVAAALRQTDDCVRKPLLTRWLLEAAP